MTKKQFNKEYFVRVCREGTNRLLGYDALCALLGDKTERIFIKVERTCACKVVVRPFHGVVLTFLHIDMVVFCVYHLLERREVVLVTPLSSILDHERSWLLPRAVFESYDFEKRPHVIHKELYKYEINETLQRVLGFED